MCETIANEHNVHARMFYRVIIGLKAKRFLLFTHTRSIEHLCIWEEGAAN